MCCNVCYRAWALFTKSDCKELHNDYKICHFSSEDVSTTNLNIHLTFVFDRGWIAQAKKAGSQLKNRQVAPASIYNWRSKIEEMEDGVREVMQAERHVCKFFLSFLWRFIYLFKKFIPTFWSLYFIWIGQIVCYFVYVALSVNSLHSHMLHYKNFFVLYAEYVVVLKDCLITMIQFVWLFWTV